MNVQYAMEIVLRSVPTLMVVLCAIAQGVMCWTLMEKHAMVSPHVYNWLLFNDHTGADINECASSNGNCSQLCTNTFGSYNCSCLSGYALNANGRTCDGNAIDLLLSHVERFFFIDL